MSWQTGWKKISKYCAHQIQISNIESTNPEFSAIQKLKLVDFELNSYQVIVESLLYTGDYNWLFDWKNTWMKNQVELKRESKEIKVQSNRSKFANQSLNRNIGAIHKCKYVQHKLFRQIC